MSKTKNLTNKEINTKIIEDVSSLIEKGFASQGLKPPWAPESPMTYDHPAWKWFLNDLGTIINVLGCDSRSLRLTKLVLEEKYPDCDFEATEEFLQEHGGFCDCEVMLNVARNGTARLLRARKRRWRNT
jgi:Protein of unknown function (DUF2695)